jgi:hypothetical protein
MSRNSCGIGGAWIFWAGVIHTDSGFTCTALRLVQCGEALFAIPDENPPGDQVLS